MRAQQQAPTDRPQPTRQEDEWSLPTTTERRKNVERQQTTHTSPLDVPPPSEERLFTDWSSEGSLHETDNQQMQSARSIESRRTEQVRREPRDEEALRHIPSDVISIPSAPVQIEQVGTGFID